MAELVANCPRCKANRITFDLLAAVTTRVLYEWQRWYEAFCVCRNCRRSTVFVLAESVDGDYDYVHKIGLTNIDGAVNRFVKVESFIGLKDTASAEPPEYMPESVERVFREAAMCLAVGCNNAAGTMFRLCIDLVTRDLLPDEDTEGLNNRTRRDLGLRLPWLFDAGKLPKDLRDLSQCVREDGNDGAHAGTLSQDEAEDLLDFTRVMLERVYTEPERLRLAEKRRERRRE